MLAQDETAINAKKPPSLLAIAAVFFNIGLWSFGGGLSGWAYRTVVQRRNWLNYQEFLLAYGLSQVLPGGNVINLTVYIGNRLRGLLGAAVAMVALLAGPFAAVLLLQAFYGEISSNAWVLAGLDGVVAAAIGLILYTGWNTARRAVTNIPSFLMLAATFVAVAVLQLPFIPVVLCIAPISVALAWLRTSRA